MGKSKLFIVFLAILLMVTTTFVTFADEVPYNCQTISYDSDGYLSGRLNLDNSTILAVTSPGGAVVTYVQLSINGYKSISYNGNVYYFYTRYSTVTTARTIRIFNYEIIDGMQLIDEGQSFINYSYTSYFNYRWRIYTSNLSEENKQLNRDIAQTLGIMNVGDTDTNLTGNLKICQFIERSPEFMAVITAILSVFTAIGDWFVEIIPTVLTVFWTPGVDGADGSLTIIGALSCAALSISVILLILRWVVDFFKFRG